MSEEITVKKGLPLIAKIMIPIGAVLHFLMMLFMIVVGVICLFGVLLMSMSEDVHVTDPAEYSRVDGGKTVSFFPESVEEFTINRYSYTAHRFLDDTCEIFLDITVTNEQFDRLITEARGYPGVLEEPAYYDGDYTEIVFTDYYVLNDDPIPNDVNRVGNAHISKVIYNEKNHNIIYEYLYALDSGSYPVYEVEYFNRFAIWEVEYSENCSNFAADPQR
ncbi:MAG: hypothetical protein IJK58_03880 [Clostridia bacterium]|nr:hypothetical protein [Clostridia bacterium]